jgi:hypothetical protein
LNEHALQIIKSELEEHIGDDIELIKIIDILDRLIEEDYSVIL